MPKPVQDAAAGPELWVTTGLNPVKVSLVGAVAGGFTGEQGLRGGWGAGFAC
jgi:hypothetical protein